MDIAKPLPNKYMILVLWHQYAKYSVVEFVPTMAAELTIRVLDYGVFTTFGDTERDKNG